VTFFVDGLLHGFDAPMCALRGAADEGLRQSVNGFRRGARWQVTHAPATVLAKDTKAPARGLTMV